MASIKKRRGTYSVVYTYENDKGEKSNVGKHLRLMQKRINGERKLNTKRMKEHFCLQTSRL